MLNKAISDHQSDFANVYCMITDAQSRSWQQVNKILIELYWSVGCYVCEKIAKEGWGKGIVEALSKYIVSENPLITGFSARNIWRMKQFYETYCGNEKLTALLTEIGWSNHLHILSKTKDIEEKEYYLQLAAKHHYAARDFGRLIDSASYERTLLASTKLSTTLTEFPTAVEGVFKDSYIFEFLGLPDSHKENDLRRALVLNLKKYLTEYETKLINKSLLHKKLHELSNLAFEVS